MDYTNFSTATINFEGCNFVNINVCTNGYMPRGSRYYIKMYNEDYEVMSTAVMPYNAMGIKSVNFDMLLCRELPFGTYDFALFEDYQCIVVYNATYSKNGERKIMMRRRRPAYSFEYTLDLSEKEDLDAFLSKLSNDNVSEDVEIDAECSLPEPDTPSELSLDDLMSEINQLKGMENIKRQLKDFFCLTKMDMLRKRYGITDLPSTNRFHCLFLGNPGTGKTTLAKMIGRVFHKLGLLSKGDVCVHSRTDLVGQFIGSTEEKMQGILEEARGNVLFIDEAYSLFNGRYDDRADYGNVVINSLLPVLTEQNPNMVVILAGYPKEMNKMLSSNPGLRSRFPHVFNFEDYDPETLYNIGVGRLSEMSFTLTDKADETFRHCIIEQWAQRDNDFANARWIENIVETGLVQTLAHRLFGSEGSQPTKDDLIMIHRCDVEAGFAKTCKPIIKPKKQNPIGFVVNR